jgi:L-malate glycosyltransferase
MTPLRILHCHSTFSLGGKEARAVRLINVFGDKAVHTVLSSVPDALGARDAIDPGIQASFPGEAAPPLYGKPSLGRYRDLTRYMKQFDLVLSYNWGSMDAVGARRIFPGGVPRLIHHEDGFNADEVVKLNWKRNTFRRIMLGTADALIVPSERLAAVAAQHWGRPDVIRIPNGIDTAAYVKAPVARSIPGLDRKPGEVIIGTLAGLRPVKNLPRLVRAVAPIPNARLVIVGEGPEREAIIAEALRCGLKDRLVMAGFLSEPARYVGHFDIFALSSDSEQFPISLVEAMAAGKPAVSTDVGDVRAIVSPENKAFVVPVEDEAMLSAKLRQLVDDAALRDRIGAANQKIALATYDEAQMIERYRQIYGIAA